MFSLLSISSLKPFYHLQGIPYSNKYKVLEIYKVGDSMLVRKPGEVIHIVGTTIYYKITNVTPLAEKVSVTAPASSGGGVPGTTTRDVTELTPTVGSVVQVYHIGIDGGVGYVDATIEYPKGKPRLGVKQAVQINCVDAHPKEPLNVDMLIKPNQYPSIKLENYDTKDYDVDLWFFGEIYEVTRISAENFEKAPDYKKIYAYA